MLNITESSVYGAVVNMTPREYLALWFGFGVVFLLVALLIAWRIDSRLAETNRLLEQLVKALG